MPLGFGLSAALDCVDGALKDALHSNRVEKRMRESPGRPGPYAVAPFDLSSAVRKVGEQKLSSDVAHDASRRTGLWGEVIG